MATSIKSGPVVLVAAVAAVATTILRRRRTSADANALWRDATSDVSR